jgi:hypothetical protein
MTPFEFQDEYLRVGSKVQGRSGDITAGGRRPIGRKGIGFLAVARYCRQVEVHSHAARTVTLSENVMLDSQASRGHYVSASFFLQPFAAALAPYTTILSVRCGAFELSPTEYRQDGPTIRLPTEIWRKLSGQTLTIEYDVDCRAVNLCAAIDYQYLLELGDDHNLSTLPDFCRLRLLPAADRAAKSGTRIVLHLREFVQRELQSPQRRGRVRNLTSAGGLHRFTWHLSRTTPIAYLPSLQVLDKPDLRVLAVPVSPTPFSVKVIGPDGETRELRRPLPNDLLESQPDDPILVRQPFNIASGGLSAQGILLGFRQAIFPAEMRGIAIRVCGVEIGPPGFLGVEDDLPTRYRPFLDQVMGEVIVTEGLDAISSIMPGREGFYRDGAQFQALRKYLVGDGDVVAGALGEVLDQLWKRHSVESSVERIVQEARRRRETLLEVSQAVTALSVGSRHSRALLHLFSRSDVVADGLRQAAEYRIELPSTIEDYELELAKLEEIDYRIDLPRKVVQLNRDAESWGASLYMLGRDFAISLRNGGSNAPLCEIDLSTNIIHLNWLHPSRGKMGDSTFAKSALFWRIAYLTADGNVDKMMDLAHRLLAFSA